MKSKMIRKLLATMLVFFSFVGCAGIGNSNTNNTGAENTQSEDDTLSFKSDNYTNETMTVNGEEIKYRAYEQIVYVENPVDEKYQCMNIYIPEAYFNGESIGKFTKDTAPIFLPNGIGGYMPAEPMSPSMEGEIKGDASREGLTSDNSGDSNKENSSPNSVLLALSKGYVVASPGARGRTNQSDEGTYTGKAPADIVDLKAAVKYLHYNNDAMPGTADKIISNGTSAGGALSSLLGASGDNSDYKSYLDELGAADASDAIYAVSAYCPITNLDNADMGYEWLFNGIKNYTSMVITNVDGKINREKVSNTLTDEQIKYSDELKNNFTVYVNNLNLRDENRNLLVLNEDGNGTFKDYVKSYVIASAKDALNSGIDLSDYKWITIENGEVTDIDFDGYITYISRSKSVPAFDSIDLSAYENSLFGTSKVDAQHFTQFSLDKDKTGGTIADSTIIKMMNPMYYIGEEGSTTSKYWRIRHGVEDSDTALSTPLILYLILAMKGYDVDFKVPWGKGHGGDYDLEELMLWMNSIV